MILNLGMAALGALIGVLIAWSASPVVAIAMPLLFGLIGGAGSFSLFKMDLTKPHNQERIKLIGGSLLACCSACLFAVIVAVLAKVFLFEKPFYEFTSSQISSVAGGTDKIMLRRRLELLGASRTEVETVFQRLMVQPDYKAIVDKIASASTNLIVTVDKRKTTAQQGGPDTPRIAPVQTPYAETPVQALYTQAQTFLTDKKLFESSSNPAITEPRFRYLTKPLYETFKSGKMTPPAQPYEPDILKAVAEFADVFLQSRETENILSETKVSEMNELIKIAGTIPETSPQQKYAGPIARQLGALAGR